MNAQRGFTLIELSIVLVVIGLIVGGVLVGRDLIAAAAVRSQIAQIDKYNQAVNTFKNKYGGIPGDLKEPEATRFGFVSRGTAQGQGDGDGVIEASCGGPYANTCGTYPFWGEQAMFWVDLSKAQLIDGNFTTATPTATPMAISGSGINSYLPQTKMAPNGYVYIFSGGWQEIANLHGFTNIPDGINYYGLAIVTGQISINMTAEPLLTVAQAFAIDKKVDDGLPQSGIITAITLGTWGPWASGGAFTGTAPYQYEPNTGIADNATSGPLTAASGGAYGTAAGATSCYDNSKGLPPQYSVTQNGGTGVNCMISFQFQ